MKILLLHKNLFIRNINHKADAVPDVIVNKCGLLFDTQVRYRTRFDNQNKKIKLLLTTTLTINGDVLPCCCKKYVTEIVTYWMKVKNIVNYL